MRWFGKWVEPKYTVMRWDTAARPQCQYFPHETYFEALVAYKQGRSRIPHVFPSGSNCYALRCAVMHQGSNRIDGKAAADALALQLHSAFQMRALRGGLVSPPP